MKNRIDMMQKALLWSIRSPHNDLESFLFGSMHVKSPVAFQNVSLLQQKIDVCTAFAAEMHLDEANKNIDLALAFRAVKGGGLKDVLGTKKYEKAKKILQKSLHLNIDAFQQLRPLFLSSLIDEQMMPKGTAPLALDHFLWEHAKSKGKHLYGLETFNDQIEVLQSITPQEEKKALLNGIKNITQHRKSIQKMMSLYEQQDITKLYKATKNSLGHWRYKMLIRRNHNMAKAFSDLSEGQHLFAAVGAAHLAGKSGMLRLLKLKGFKVIPINT